MTKFLTLTSIAIMQALALSAHAEDSRQVAPDAQPQATAEVQPQLNTEANAGATAGANTEAKPQANQEVPSRVMVPQENIPNAQSQQVSQPAQEAPALVGGDLRAPSPKIFDHSRRGYFDAAAGPAYGIGFASDSLMYNVQGAYNMNINDRIIGKALADLYIGSGTVSSRLMNFGVAADFVLPEVHIASSGLPYVSGEVMVGNGRNADDQTATGLALGTAAGYKFQADQLNLDVSAHYALLTSRVGSTSPSVLGLRLGANF